LIVHHWVGITSTSVSLYTMFVTMYVAMVSQCLCSTAMHFYFTTWRGQWLRTVSFWATCTSISSMMQQWFILIVHGN